MKLLISPINSEEAVSALNGGADIIDVKNPKEGSLGANFPWVIKEVKEAIGSKKPVSATLGDFNYKPGTAALAAFGAATAGANYVKIGLYDIRTEEQAYDLLTGIVKTAAMMEKGPKVVACAYSDCERIDSLPPSVLPEIGARAGVDLVMVDTGVKDGASTFEFMSEEELTAFVEKAHELGLETAIAGSLKFDDLPLLKKINPDIIGVRGMVCGGDRTDTIREELVEELKAKL
jgi:uncharacterized protein (UPF0264 family)